MKKARLKKDVLSIDMFTNPEKLYRSMIDDSLDGYYAIDTDGCIVFANQGLALMLGYHSADELVGNDFFKAIPIEKLEKLKNELDTAFIERANGIAIRTKARRKDGVIVALEIKPFFIFEGGKFLGTRGIILDVTQQMELQKKLMDKEKRLSMLFENANAAIFTMEGEVFTDCNQMTIKMFDCDSKADIVGHFPWEFSPPFQPDGKESSNSAKEKIQDALNGIPQRFYWKHCTKNKILFDAEVMLNAVKVDNQVILQSVVTNITARMVAEEALKRSEEKYHSLFENATIGIYQTTPEGEIIIANSAAINMLGCSSLEELRQRNLEKEGFGPTYSREQFINQIEEDGEINGIEAVWKKSDGTDVYVRESAKAIKDPNGNILYYEGTVEDVTVGRVAQNQLIEHKNRLQELNATKDKFFSIIAHDLKTPFNSIVGFSGLLLEEVEEKNYLEVLKYAQIILKSSENAMGLLNSLLNWARAQTGHLEFNQSSFDLTEVIHGVVNLFQDAYFSKYLSINIKMPDNSIMFADKAMIETVLRNLISNAIKFTPNHGDIDISMVIVNNEFVVSISDTGVGMDMESMERLFKIEESFSKSGTNNEIGTGLGLILCDEFIRKHQGKIWVKSAKGHGSIFYFSIPINE